MTVSLDGQISSTYPVTAGVPQGSILGPILFLVYINDLSDNMICDLAMFADDSSLYSYTDCKSTINTSQNLTDSLGLDLSKVSRWGDRWLVKFNSAKTKLLSVNRYKNPYNFPVSFSHSVLDESPSIRLVGLTLSSNLSWNEYIKSIAKQAAKKVGSLFRARSYLSRETILYLYKSLIRPCMEYCCHVWAGASSDALSLLDRIQKRICNIVGPDLASCLQPLSIRRDVASLSLLYKYFHGRCSSELSSLVPPLKVFNRRTRLSSSSHPFTLATPSCKKQFYSSSFFPRTTSLWNSLPSSCFPDDSNLPVFKSRVNRFLSHPRVSETPPTLMQKLS